MLTSAPVYCKMTNKQLKEGHGTFNKNTQPRNMKYECTDPSSGGQTILDKRRKL